jgi:replication factor C subunit 3/5
MYRVIKIFLRQLLNLLTRMLVYRIVCYIQWLTREQRLPHLLLYGPPGTGKTSTILALARRIYGNKNVRQMVLELNASDDRGIDVVREQIKTFASRYWGYRY